MYQQIFKNVGWTQGVFQVSNYGRIYNTKTKHFLKGTTKQNGYVEVVLSYNGTREKWRLNRLVATVWQRQMLKTEQAHHKNHFKWCNCNQNLQIKDGSEHNRDHKLGTKDSQQTKTKKSNTHKGKPKMYLKGKKRSQQSIAKREQTRRQKRLLDPNYGKRKKKNNGLKPLGKCPYTSTGLWFGITE